ncbi:hypothetical protein EXS74_02180 [Candidatus Woesearchaeota archaeon]|nr:hypothetical protein [Candidatus Woesearchaeota archaeon]
MTQRLYSRAKGANEREGTYNGREIRFEPSRLGILFERLSLDRSWILSDKEKGLRTKEPSKTYQRSTEVHQDQFSYQAAIPQTGSKLEQALEDPISEKITIREHSGAYTITITRNPSISRWRNNTRVLVTKIDREGKEEEKRRFRLEDLSSIDKYVRGLL